MGKIRVEAISVNELKKEDNVNPRLNPMYGMSINFKLIEFSY